MKPLTRSTGVDLNSKIAYIYRMLFDDVSFVVGRLDGLERAQRTFVLHLLAVNHSMAAKCIPIERMVRTFVAIVFFAILWRRFGRCKRRRRRDV